MEPGKPDIVKGILMSPKSLGKGGVSVSREAIAEEVEIRVG